MYTVSSFGMWASMQKTSRNHNCEAAQLHVVWSDAKWHIVARMIGDLNM